MKKIKILLSALVMLLVTTAFCNVASASEVKPMDWMVYGWGVWGKGVYAYPYSGWKPGPSGRGPATLSFSKSITIQRGYTGTLTVGVKKLSAAVGFNVSASDQETASYSITPPSGKTYQIIYRIRYTQWKVTQREYEDVDGTIIWLNKYAYVYPKKYRNFDFSYKQL